MVKRSSNLDSIFSSLSDPTRRDILQRLLATKKDLTIGDIAKPYTMSFAAVSKHLKILEASGLVVKQRAGKEQKVRLHSVPLKSAAAFLQKFLDMPESRSGIAKYIPFLR